MDGKLSIPWTVSTGIKSFAKHFENFSNHAGKVKLIVFNCHIIWGWSPLVQPGLIISLAHATQANTRLQPTRHPVTTKIQIRGPATWPSNCALNTCVKIKQKQWFAFLYLYCIKNTSAFSCTDWSKDFMVCVVSEREQVWLQSLLTIKCTEMRSNCLKGKLLLCKDYCSITDNDTYTEASQRVRVRVALAEL